MKIFQVIIFILVSLVAHCQPEPKFDWDYRSSALYTKAFQEYLVLTQQTSRNYINYDPKLPEIGIYLLFSRIDSVAKKEYITVRFCFDESWKANNFDYYSFYSNSLLLINKNSKIYPSHEALEAIIQDRVYTRKQEVKRKIIALNAVRRNGVSFEEDKYGGWSINDGDGNYVLFRKPPFNQRLIVIDHAKGSFEIE